MKPDRYRAPLYEALIAHAQLRATPFHVPGHKQRTAWGEPSAGAYYEALLALDLTELADTDDLHHPEGPLLEAQELAADCFGADETRFLVGGSTSGNLAMILGVCQPGELVIVQRNVHKSVIHGLMLAGARAILLPPSVDEASGLATIPAVSLLDETLKRYPEAKAVILSSPNYYGMSSDLEPLVAAAHACDVPVLVDEAHGAHFGFHPELPNSALRAGADAVVQSTHKMLGGMTMGAMLHLQGDRLERTAVRQALTMVQSSSPSFPILASLDLARRQLHVQSEQAFYPALRAVRTVVEALERMPFGALGYGNAISKDIVYDPLKLVLFHEAGKLSGFALRDALLEQGCVPEMADERYAVLALGTGSIEEDGVRLSKALNAIADSLPILPHETDARPRKPTTEGMALSLPEPVRFGYGPNESREVPLEHSIGETAAEWVIPYPPGIPMLFPGETITESTVDQLIRWRHEGARIQGAKDPGLRTIRIQSGSANEG